MLQPMSFVQTRRTRRRLERTGRRIQVTPPQQREHGRCLLMPWHSSLSCGGLLTPRTKPLGGSIGWPGMIRSFATRRRSTIPKSQTPVGRTDPIKPLHPGGSDNAPNPPDMRLHRRRKARNPVRASCIPMPMRRYCFYLAVLGKSDTSFRTSIVQLVKKLKDKGALGALEAIVRRTEARFGRLGRRIQALRQLRDAKHEAVFAQEGGLTIKLPRYRWRDAVFGSDPWLMVSSDFLKCSTSEPLLRHIVFSLFSHGKIERGRMVVDIGCWCGDNALAWAKCLHAPGGVIAVDPSERNLDYARALARENGITNVTWIQAVCSDRAGVPLAYNGPLEHTSFHDATARDRTTVLSSTLDAVVGAENLSSIGLMHLDVEGFEARVIEGASRIIAQSRPIIIFEQHLCTDDTRAIAERLTQEDYQIYLVNELIVDCRLDCRNFLAIPSEITLAEDILTSCTGHVPAVPGPFLLPYAAPDAPPGCTP